MKEYKVGDRVRVLDGNSWTDPCLGRVVELRDANHPSICVLPDGDNSGMGWWINKEFIERIATKKICGGELL